MTPLDAAATAERQNLEAAIRSNPTDPMGWVNLAKYEAKLWIQDPGSADLNRILAALERALNFLPAANQDGVKQFVTQLAQRGASLGPAFQSGSFPRLAALVGGAAPASAPAQPAPAPQPAQPSPAAPQAAPAPIAPATSGAAVRIRDINVGEVNMVKIKQWIDGNAVEELVNAYPMIDNFRTRRVIIDKIAEQKTPLCVAAMIRILAQTHDDSLENELRRRLLAYEPELLNPNLVYDANDAKTKAAVIGILALQKSETALEPLMEALHDNDGHVRSLAVEGLSEMFEASPEWIGQLLSMIRSDPDPQARMAAAKGLAATNSKDALVAFEQVSSDSSFDQNLHSVLRDMKTKIGGGEKKAGRTDTEKKAPGFKIDPGQVVKIGGGVGVVAFVAFMLFKLMMVKLEPPVVLVPAPPPPPEVKAENARRQQELIERFQEAVKNGEQLNAAEEAAKLQAPIPAADSPAAGSTP